MSANFPWCEILNAIVLWSRGQMAESHLEFTKPAHVVGRYALYGRLAAGGMATVHLGRVLEADGLSRTVAVKRLHPQFCKDPEFVAMFIDEARLAARIKHPNVVETLDILTMGQELLLVMEYIRGECFSKLLRAARRKNLEPSIGVVGRIASGMLHGLHAAHEATDDKGDPLNVVHRDISPQNVMIDVDGGVKVLDFGVAKASARIQITRDGQMKGKLSYMSPEQLQGLPVDRRADIFACGVVLWEALTRRRLFVGEDASEVLRKILRDEVPPPSQFVPGLSPEVDRVVRRALCKDPEQRYQTALELALDIEQIIGLAPERDVSAWIYSVAGEILTKRERLLQEIERLGPEVLAFNAGDASSASLGHGSITDSDTFQRIQSWAEREAARAADASLIAEPDVVFDDGAEAVPTVADVNCVDPASIADIDRLGVSSAADLYQALHEVDDSASLPTSAGEPSFADLDRPPAFPFAAASAPPEERQRRRRVFTAVAASGVFMALVGAALVALKPASLVRTTSGALRPETSVSAPLVRPSQERGASLASLEQPAVPTPSERLATGHGTATPVVGSNLPVSPGRAAAATPSAVVGASGGSTASAVSSGSSASGAAAMNGASAASNLSAGGAPALEAPIGESAASRVNQALSQASKDRAQSAAKKPVAKQHPAAVARRSRPVAPRAASNKLDCRQPYWVDDRGIRRLKLACL